MAHSTPTQTIANRVRDVRKRRGLSAQRLAEKLAEQGVNWDRYTVTKLENGKRQNVTVSELLALAAVLNVAPVHLLIPSEAAEGDAYQVTPTTAVPVETARGWVRGHHPLPGSNTVQYHAEMPEEEQGRIYLPPAKDADDRIRGIEESIVHLTDALESLKASKGEANG